MSSGTIQELREVLALIGSACVSLGKPLASAIETRAARAVSAYRAEVQRTALAVALAIAIALLGCGAVAMALFSLILSLWDAHRVLGVGLAAAVLALFTLLGLVWLQSTTRRCER